MQVGHRSLVVAAEVGPARSAGACGRGELAGLQKKAFPAARKVRRSVHHPCQRGTIKALSRVGDGARAWSAASAEIRNIPSSRSLCSTQEESGLLGLASNCSNGVLVLRLQGLPLRLHIELVSQALPLRLRLWPGVGLRATAFRFIKEKACP
ncbi:methyl-accepting chemotaxis protein [Comamonas thiooxydans]|nr:methyl-accepting chemotaxis protein [Comamonas thiooxydans]